MTKMTEHDKKLLSGLAAFCLGAVVMAYGILPLHAANAVMKDRTEAGRLQLEEMERKSRELSKLQAEHEEWGERLAASQSGLYPVLEVQEIDGLLTEKAAAAGLSIRRMEIHMPENAQEAMEAAEAELEIVGSEERIWQLIDAWSEEAPGIGVAGFSWEDDPGDPAGSVLRLRLEVWMSRRDEQEE